MKTHIIKTVSVVITLFILFSLAAIPVSAVSYIAGANGVSDSYQSSAFYGRLQKITLTGDGRTDLIAVALSQIGYMEGNSDEELGGESAGDQNFTEYNYNMGDFGYGYGDNNSAKVWYEWCASFVSWSLLQSCNTTQNTMDDWCRRHYGDKNYIWRELSCSGWADQLRRCGYFENSKAYGGEYIPQSGDLIFFQYANATVEGHIGIVIYADSTKVYTVEGNTNNGSELVSNGGSVCVKSYPLEYSLIRGYGTLPYKTADTPAIDYSGKKPTAGLYIANGIKHIYTDETCTQRAKNENGTNANIYTCDMFEVTGVSTNGNALEVEFNGISGYILSNNADVDKVYQLSVNENIVLPAETPAERLKKLTDEAENISVRSYSDDTISNIGIAYKSAMSLLNSTTANDSQFTSAADRLEALLANTSSNSGVRIDYFNRFIGSGECNIFTSDFNGGNLALGVSNHAYTTNVIAKFDSALGGYVVTSVTDGAGTSTPAITLNSGEILIAAHEWSAVSGSAENKAALKKAKAGQIIKFCGVDVDNKTLDFIPYIKIVDVSDIPDTENDIVYGDIDMDGEVEIVDYVYLKRAFFGTYKLSEDQFLRANINDKNDEIDITDYVLCKRIFFGTYTK